jgi:predicted nucleic acid-binding protein
MLVDTSGLLCVLHRDEPQHAEAARLYTTAPTCLTQSYVLAELVALGHRRGLH